VKSRLLVVMAMVAVLLAVLAMTGTPSSAATGTGTVVHIKVHGKSLEGNLEDDSPDRDVSVYLPPSYAKDKSRHYPVVYFLHGFTDSDDKWYGPTKHWINLPSVVDKALANADSKEMIFVTPNAFTRYQGSMYSSSVTTGDWEKYVSEELVAYIDSHYRTIPKRSSRGLAGHSMGGYGTLRIGMKHPDVYSSIYMMSACCISATFLHLPDEGQAKAALVNDPAEVDKAEFLTKIVLASAAAWSPDPKNPPLYLEVPGPKGPQQEAVYNKWTANAPLAQIDGYIDNLRQLKAIAMDVGDSDHGINDTTKELDQVLNKYQISHFFEIYTGDHLNHIADRIETKLVPFFSKNLVFDPKAAK
jgi:S-formylglutathione hydrolase